MFRIAATVRAHSFIRRLAAFVVILLGATAAFADSIPITSDVPPLATINMGVTDSHGRSSSSSDFVCLDVDGAGACVNGLGPSVSVTGSTGGSSFAELFYNFAVNGPVGNTVDVRFSGADSLFVSGNALGDVFLNVGSFNDGATLRLLYDSCNGACLTGGLWDATMHGVMTGFDYTVLMVATGVAGSGALDSYHFTLDPSITVLGPDADQYTIAYSTNLPTGAAPEPSSLALFGSGLTCVGAWLRRKKR